MSTPKKQPEAQPENADLVLLNTVSRLGCTVGEARKILAEQAKAQQLSTQAQQPASQQSSKGESSDEALL